MFRRALLQSTRHINARAAVPAAARSRVAAVPASLVHLPRAVAQPLQRRAYSADAKEKKPGKEKAKKGKEQQQPGTKEEGANGDGEKKPELEAAQRDLEAAKKETLDYKDKFTRSVAEYRNLQDRTERDKRAAREFAIQGFAKDLLDSIDNLGRALGAVPTEAREPATDDNKALVDLYGGLQMTESILLGTLRKHGVERVDPSGEPFDPNRHEAVFQAPSPDKDPGTVMYVQQTGYVLNGRTLRAAKVGVVAAPQKEA